MAKTMVPVEDFVEFAKSHPVVAAQRAGDHMVTWYITETDPWTVVVGERGQFKAVIVWPEPERGYFAHMVLESDPEALQALIRATLKAHGVRSRDGAYDSKQTPEEMAAWRAWFATARTMIDRWDESRAAAHGNGIAMRCFACTWAVTARPQDVQNLAAQHLSACAGPVVARRWRVPGHEVVTEYVEFVSGSMRGCGQYTSLPVGEVENANA